MDVGCPKCQTEYELDDSRVTEDGVTVKCATCGHVFRVKKKSLVVTLPATGETPSATLPPPPPSREWKIKTPRGSFPCRDLTMLQKWIIEGKVHREDEISLTGETWKRLGDIPELGSFFQIYDDASKGRALAEAAANQRQATAAAPPQQPPPPPPQAAPPAPPRESAKITDTWKGGNFSTPAPEQLVPTEVMPAKKRETDRDVSFGQKPITDTLKGAELGAIPRSSPSALSPAELKNVKRGGSGKWVALIIVGLIVGGGVGYYFGIYEPQLREQARLDEELRAKTLPPPTPTPTPVVEVDAGAEVVDAGALELDAGAAVEDAGAQAEDAGVDAGIEVDAGVADAGVTVDAGVQEPKTYEYFLKTADRLRNREKPEAALDYYGRASDLKPDRAEPYAGKGLCLLDMANPTAAVGAFTEALKLNRRYGPAIMGMAEAQRATGNKEKAIEYYEKYLEVLPEGPEAAVARNGIERLKK